MLQGLGVYLDVRLSAITVKGHCSLKLPIVGYRSQGMHIQYHHKCETMLVSIPCNSDDKGNG